MRERREELMISQRQLIKLPFKLRQNIRGNLLALDIMKFLCLLPPYLIDK